MQDIGLFAVTESQSTSTTTRTIPNFDRVVDLTMGRDALRAIRRRMYKEGPNTLTSNFGLELLLNLNVKVTLDRSGGLSVIAVDSHVAALGRERGSRIRDIVDSKSQGCVG